MACRGVMKWRRELLHLKRRFMKHGFAVWSNPSDYEAPLDSGMKRSLFRLHVFLPEIRAKKMGCKFLFPHLVLTRENSNLFSANRNNCKTFPLRLFTWIEVLLILFMLCITITLCLRLPVDKKIKNSLDNIMQLSYITTDNWRIYEEGPLCLNDF